MIRYFVSYKNLIHNNKLDKKLDINSPELKLIKKNKNGTYRVEPLLYFTGYVKDFLSYAEKIDFKKKGMNLVVELSEEESKKLNELYVISFISNKDNSNILEHINKDIKLLNYNALANMNIKDIEDGEFNDIVSVKNTSNSKETYFIEDDKEHLYDIYEIRKKLIMTNIVSDLYFYTSNKKILERYNDELITLREVEPDIYKLINKKIFVIDSVPQDRIYDLSNSTLRHLYTLCNNSIPISIGENDDGTYNLSNYQVDRRRKKAYIILDSSLQNLLYDSSIVPLLKYINIYEYKNGVYRKSNIENYMKTNNILKYIKKPSSN